MKNKIWVIIIIILFVSILVIAKNITVEKPPVEAENVSKNSGINAVVDINTDDFLNVVLNSNTKVLVDFYADWCEPCKILSPLVEEIANENTSIEFYKVNVDDNDELANKYRIMYIPTLIVFDNGKEIGRTIGVVEKSKIEEMIKWCVASRLKVLEIALLSWHELQLMI